MTRFEFILMAVLLAASSAQASLIGSTITVSNTDGLPQLDAADAASNCLNVVVGSGIECKISDRPAEWELLEENGGFDDLIEVDVMDSAILFGLRDVSQLASFVWSGGSPIIDINGQPTGTQIFDVIVDGLTSVGSPGLAIASISQTYTPFGSEITGSVSASLTGRNQVTMTFDNFRGFAEDCSGLYCATLQVEITFEDGNMTPVPLPAGLSLLGGAIALVGAMAVRRRRA
jgi:hypothetical protein